VTKTLRLGTRGSALALWQANTVATLLARHGRETELVTIRTSGDRIQDRPLSEAGGKGLFVKEIEDALLAGTIDLAVHSAKDMSVAIPPGLAVAAVLPREDPRDALVVRAGHTLPSAGAIGTGSVRRSAQLSVRLPRARFLPVRGNVDTRLRKLDAGEFDALILAAAGLMRLGYSERISEAIPYDECIPAPGQGIIAIETRVEDADDSAWRAIDDADTAAAFHAERAVVEALGGGCQLPLGAVTVQEDGRLVMHAIVTSADGRQRVRRTLSGDIADPRGLGRRIAAELADAGAIHILNSLR
jgi:hydroxymethylbilane synthase